MPSTQNDLTPRDRLAVALDLPNEYEALKLVDRLGQTCQWYKVGMELYYAAGNSIVKHLRNRGFNVFLDLKLHDIPNTVAGAVRSATQAGASLLTIHAMGGAAIMSAAAEAPRGGTLLCPRRPPPPRSHCPHQHGPERTSRYRHRRIPRQPGPPPSKTRP